MESQLMPGREALKLVHSAGPSLTDHPTEMLFDGSLALQPDQPALTPDRPNLQLVPKLSEAPALISADVIQELAPAREQAGIEASAILARNRERLTGDNHEDVPRPVDALGTARQAVAIKRRYGADSPQYREVFTGVVLDSERLLAEAFSKNTAEYFAKLLQKRDQRTGAYSSHGLVIGTMTRNGLSPLAHPEEIEHRKNEHVEEVGTYEAIGNMIGSVGLRGTVEKLAPYVAITAPNAESTLEAPELTVDVTTVSECPDYAIEDYKQNPKGSHGGYAPGIEKYMLRRVHFSSNSGDRYEEQVAVSGEFVDEEVRRSVLADEALAEQVEQASKTELQGTQWVGVNSGSVMNLQRKFDQAASLKHGKNIFMGEEVPEDHTKDYGEFIAEAEIRRQKLAPKPTELANYLIDMEERGISSRQAEVMVDKFLKRTLLEVARKNPELAEAMFDKETADGFREVARLEASGRHGEAQNLLRTVEENAPAVSYCGAGSCGLETVAFNSPQAFQARQLGLTKGEILHDTERPCPDCGAMEVVYDEGGSKACLACQKTEIKGED